LTKKLQDIGIILKTMDHINGKKTWNFTTRQSPINIETVNVKHDSSLGNYNINRTVMQWKSLNKGLNVSTSPAEDIPIQVTGGALGDKYQLAEFHLHWGNKENCGCEHTVNGRRYAAELHMVHWNCDKYASVPEAMAGKDGLAVLGVFLDVHDSYKPNGMLEQVLDLFHTVKYKGQTKLSTSTFTPYNLLPGNVSDYFTYLGSLTTPPLTENVTWTVFKEPIKISQSQLTRFNEICAIAENTKSNKFGEDMFTRNTKDIPQPPTITNNYRPVQPMNGRQVRSSFKI